MRVVTALLLAALVAVLSVIAGELHRIGRELAPPAALSAGILSLDATTPASREQRVQRILREQRDGDAEIAAYAEALRRRAASRQR